MPCGHGINYFDAFIRDAGRARDSSWRGGLKTLSEFSIPFARVSFSPYHPSDWALYMEDRDEYFRRMGEFLDGAREAGIRIVPSVFWNHSAIPDLCGEPVSAVGDENSATRRFMREYLDGVLSRFASHPAVAAWEFGNEWTLFCDIPGDAAGLPYAAPELGTPAARTPKDKISRKMAYSAYAEFARAVRARSPGRPVLLGDAMPRESAWHNANCGTWEKDTPAQAEEMLLADNLHSDAIGVHIYCRDPDEAKRALELARRAARRAGKPLFIGEWGPAAGIADAGKRREIFLEVSRALGRDPSAFWCFDIPSQPEFNVSAGNEKRYVLERLKAMNRADAGNETAGDPGNARRGSAPPRG